MFRRLACSAAFCIALVPLAAPAEDLPDGTWKWTSEIGEQTIRSVLHLESDGKQLQGKYQDQNIETAIQNGEVDGRNVWFEFTAEVQNVQLLAKFSGELSDTEIDGSVKLIVDGEDRGEFDWMASRFVGNKEVLGTWNFEFTSPDGVEHRPVMVITEKDGELAGTMSANGNMLEVESLKTEDNVLSFEYTIDYGGRKLGVRYHCDPRGDRISGTLVYNLEGEIGDFEIEATRKTLPRKIRALLGPWQFSMTGPDGVERKPVLKLIDQGGQLVAKLSSDKLEVTVDDPAIDGDKISFDFTNQHEGQTVRLKWTCQAVGDNEMKGTLQYDADGNTGEVDISGKRK